MSDLKLFIQGFIVGIGKIIPGVSGAMFAMMFGIYEKALNIISNLTIEFKKNFKYIMILGVSVSLAIILGSNIIKTCLDKYYLQTMLLFIGMMTAGIKPLFKNIKGEKLKTSNIICAIVVVLLLVLLSFVDAKDTGEVLNKNISTLFMLFLSGFLDAFATVVPGICGTALLIILGYYDIVIGSLSNIFDFSNLANNLYVLIPFGIGMIMGIYLISKLINYLFKHHKIKTYYSIIGFAIMSVFLLIVEVLENSYNLSQIIISIILFIVGYIIVYVLEKSK